MFSLVFFSLSFFGCWVFCVRYKRDAYILLYAYCVCACTTYNEDTVESLFVCRLPFHCHVCLLGLRRGAAEDSVASRFAIFQSTSPKKWQNGRSRADVRRPRRLEGVSKAYKTERTHRRKCVCTYIVLKVSRLLHPPWSS